MKSELQQMKELQEAIAEAEKELYQAEGRLQILYNQLRESFDLSSIKNAQVRITAIGKERTKVATDMHNSMERLKEKYEW